MEIKIDEKIIKVSDKNKNIVEIAHDNGIHIPAPCFRAKRKNGCCNGCAVLIDDVIQYACVVHPSDSMNIIVNTQSLKELRKKNMKIYSDNIKQGKSSSCGCDCTCGSDCC